MSMIWNRLMISIISIVKNTVEAPNITSVTSNKKHAAVDWRILRLNDLMNR
jgi:hypothetical protein